MPIKNSIAHVTLSFSVPAKVARSALIHETRLGGIWRRTTEQFLSLCNRSVDGHRNRMRNRRINTFFRNGLQFGPNFSLRPAVELQGMERLLGSRFVWGDAFMSELPKVDAVDFSNGERMIWETKLVYDQPDGDTPFIPDLVVDTDPAFAESEDYKIRNVLASLFLRTRTITSAPTFLKRHCFLWLPPGRMTMKTTHPGPELGSTYVVVPVVGFTRRSDEVVFRRTFTVTIFFIPTDASFSNKRTVTTDELSRLIASVPRFPFFNQERGGVELTGDLATFAPAAQAGTQSGSQMPMHEWVVDVLCRQVFQGLLGENLAESKTVTQQFIGSTLLQSWLISRIWSVVSVCDGELWSVERTNTWGTDALNGQVPEEAMTKELIGHIEQITGYRVPARELTSKIFLDSFGLAKLREQTTYLAFYEPERSTFLDFCPSAGERYPFMSLYLLVWRLPMALGLSSTNALSNLFHHDINRSETSKNFYQHVRDIVLEFEDAYDLDILLEAFRAQYASARKLEGVDRDYTHLVTESTILFQQVAADSSRKSSRHLALLTWVLVLLTAALSLDALRPFICLRLTHASLFPSLLPFISKVCS